MVILGKVTHDIFHSEDDSFHIVAVMKDGASRTIPATYVGMDPPVPRPRIVYEFHGEEEVHPKYGKRFAIESYGKSKEKISQPMESMNRHMKKLDKLTGRT
jgi:hypothetical protein